MTTSVTDQSCSRPSSMSQASQHHGAQAGAAQQRPFPQGLGASQQRIEPSAPRPLSLRAQSAWARPVSPRPCGGAGRFLPLAFPLAGVRLPIVPAAEGMVWQEYKRQLMSRSWLIAHTAPGPLFGEPEHTTFACLQESLPRHTQASARFHRVREQTSHPKRGTHKRALFSMDCEPNAGTQG